MAVLKAQILDAESLAVVMKMRICCSIKTYKWQWFTVCLCASLLNEENTSCISLSWTQTAITLWNQCSSVAGAVLGTGSTFLFSCTCSLDWAAWTALCPGVGLTFIFTVQTMYRGRKGLGREKAAKSFDVYSIIVLCNARQILSPTYVLMCCSVYKAVCFPE